MKPLMTLFAAAALALASGCASTNSSSDQASLGAVSGTSSCCAGKTECTAEQRAACASKSKTADKPALSATEGAASSCASSCASKAASCGAKSKTADKPALSATEGTASNCATKKGAASCCPFSKKSE